MSTSDDYPLPAPAPDGLSAQWYRFLAGGELRFQRCDRCGDWRHPPRFLCAECGSGDWSWQASARSGRVFSWTITHRPLHPMFSEVLPYSILVVELDEGPRIVCSARNLPHGDLALDLPVTIGIARLSEAAGLPFARPVSGGESR